MGQNGGTEEIYSYEYYTNGNLKRIKYNDSILAEYEYDEFNRLKVEKNYQSNIKYVMIYDEGGNIRQKQEYDLTTGAVVFYNQYGYPSSGWRDLLSSYNGQPIIYDPAGNPISYRGATLSWEHGRQLASYSKGGKNLSFEYDYAGIRTKKVAPYNNGSRTTYYYLEGNRIIAEKIGEDTPIWYYYDATGVCGMEYKIDPNNSNPDEYFFEKNILGDVVAIWDSNGTLEGRYTYDAWGNILSVTDAQGNDIDPTDEYSIMNLNSFRYRGYYYDKETNLYYLNSRYYDPETGRFINADDPSVLLETATMPFGVNLFAYCNDNPVMGCDPTGEFWDYVFDAAFLIWSVVDVIKNPGDWGNWVSLGVDLVFAVIPFITSGAGQVIKVGNKIDNAWDVASMVNKLDNINDVGKLTMIGRNMDRVTDVAKFIGEADNLYDAWKGYDRSAKGLKKLIHNCISMAHNGGWLFGKLRKGYTVIDIGVTTMHKGIKAFGLWYGTERAVLALWKTRNIWKLPLNLFL